MQTLPSLKSSLRTFKKLNRTLIGVLLLIGIVMLIVAAPRAGADGYEKVTSLIGPNDSLLVADSEGRIVISKNENTELVPASILKLLTSLIAFRYLGPDFRYATEFYLDKYSNLKIKGFGDPLLIHLSIGIP